MKDRSSISSIVFGLAALAFVAAACAPAPSPPVLAAGCYDSAGIANDVEYVGPIDTHGSALIWSSQDGSCTGTSAASAFVIAPDEPAAEAKCLAAHPGYTDADHMASIPYEYPVPGNIWGCLPLV